ncbi:DUF4153 domain-containing protein [Nocardiopsis sp. NPDC058631]|uniref:DUF4153 domain-containing protein n=1 Tax=Nocardiopsis sp. NPDC058631 TaxID=3346566 RepID=UPI00364EFBE5
MSSERTTGGDAESPDGGTGPGATSGDLQEDGSCGEPAGARVTAPPVDAGPHPFPAHPREPHPRNGPYSPPAQTYAERYQQQHHFWQSRPRLPLPAAPAWLPVALLGVGVVAALLATFDRPGIGLVITGAVAGLTAMAALTVRPSAPGGSGTDGVGGTGADGDVRAPDVLPAENVPDGASVREAAEGGADPVPGAEAEAPGEEASPTVVADTAGHRPDRHARTWSAVYGVIAAALLLTAALRDAGWVLFWTLTSSFFFASLAFSARNPSSRGGAVGVLTGAFSLFRDLPSTPRFLMRPLQGGRGRRLVGPVLLTTAVTGGLLLVFGVLFSFADAVFASYMARMFEGVFSGSTFSEGFGRLFATLATVLFTGSAVLTATRRRAPRPAPVDQPGPASAPQAPPLPVWVWTIPLGALVLLFAAFLGVQAVAMFGGDDHVQRVAGVTYAEYARQGFFQLVVVSLLVLCVIAVAVHVLPSRPAAVRTLRNVLLGLLCVLTLVILASAMMRLQLYIDAYGLTRLRISAEAWIAWSAGVFGLVVAAGVLNTLGRPAAWLPRVTTALAGVALAVFAYGNPDLRIAESHHDLESAQVDTWYLRYLSADALPALLELEGDDRGCALVVLADRLDDPGGQGFASWNLSRHRGALETGLFDNIDEQGNAGCWERYPSGY